MLAESIDVHASVHTLQMNGSPTTAQITAAPCSDAQLLAVAVHSVRITLVPPRAVSLWYMTETIPGVNDIAAALFRAVGDSCLFARVVLRRHTAIDIAATLRTAKEGELKEGGIALSIGVRRLIVVRGVCLGVGSVGVMLEGVIFVAVVEGGIRDVP